MSVYLDRDTSSRRLSLQSRFGSDSELADSESLPIRIGLVNNMPDGALKATERQFMTLLNLASDRVPVLLSLYAMPDVHRTDSGRRYLGQSYSCIEKLWNADLDGLIVTGAEPKAAMLTDEVYWPSLTKVIDWAERNTCSTIWSCLAAQAAVLHMDGISRRPLGAKRFGIFQCTRTSGHQLTDGILSPAPVPHSRCNDLSEDDLAECGYQILTRSIEGADLFVKRTNSLFILFQGHPEYDADTLLREYLRDVKRYLRGDRLTYPGLPQEYFDDISANIFSRLRARAMAERHDRLMETLPGIDIIGDRLVNRWRPNAVHIYRNWLRYLENEKERRSRARSRRKTVDTEAVFGMAARIAEV